MDLEAKLEALSDKYGNEEIDSIVLEVLDSLQRLKELEFRLAETENLLGFLKSS